MRDFVRGLDEDVVSLTNSVRGDQSRLSARTAFVTIPRWLRT